MTTVTQQRQRPEEMLSQRTSSSPLLVPASVKRWCTTFSTERSKSSACSTAEKARLSTTRDPVESNTRPCLLSESAKEVQDEKMTFGEIQGEHDDNSTNHDFYEILTTAKIEKIAGGFNSVYVAEMEAWKHELSSPQITSKVIVRIPCGEDSRLLSNRIENEVTIRKLISKRLPHVPVPKVYDYHATNDPKTAFIVEEFISGTPLECVWLNLSDDEKDSYARQIAQILFDLAEIRFNMIAGFCNSSNDPSHRNRDDFSYTMAGAPHLDNEFEYAPTIEYCKMIDGREKIHSNSCYPIGPYNTTKDYFLGCYDKEVFHYTNTDEAETWNGTCPKSHGRELAKQRKALSYDEFIDGPFVLIHGDFHGRNIMVDEGRVSGVLDWEFAGSYPLSQVFFEGITFVDSFTHQDEFKFYQENKLWEGKVKEYLARLARERNWEEGQIDMLCLGFTDPKTRKVRRTMEPFFRGEDQ